MYDLMSGRLAPKPVSEVAVSTTLSPEEKLSRARAAVDRARIEKAAADKKLADAKALLEKAEAEAKAGEKPASK